MTGADKQSGTVAIWAITERGAELGCRLAGALPNATLHLSEKLERPADWTFTRLSDAVHRDFNGFSGHIFIMSTGIVVRLIAPMIRHKTTDPAVVVMDEMGNHAVSLLSGHLGGANRLAKTAAGIVGADPVITTATDVNALPAIDMLAQKADLVIENPEAIKHVNAAILNREPVDLHDPFGLMATGGDDAASILWQARPDPDAGQNTVTRPGVFIDDRVVSLPETTLVLRPRTLAVGMGCNRGTDVSEMEALLRQTLSVNRLSIHSLKAIASVDIKRDETGLNRLAAQLKRPIVFFTRDQLGRVKTIETPSAVVEKHIGVKSVCEAAAILASNGGRLVVPKQISPNVTVAVARENSTS